MKTFDSKRTPTVLPVLKFPDRRLRKISKPVERITGSLRLLIEDMLETMYSQRGIGLAAIQVGIPKRLMVIDIHSKEDSQTKLLQPGQPMCIINPVIKSYSEETCLFEEGCLSVPGEYLEIRRPSSLCLSYLDETGKACNISAEGLLARVIQHEHDHLIGRLLIDYLTRADPVVL